MTDGSGCFVQFPHPARKHVPPGEEMPWNAGKHRRKFLIAPGRHCDHDARVGEGDLVFWGEWEPPSRVVRRWAADNRLPRALHRPYWIRPNNREFRQNTDPWVWGQRTLYSNCGQTHTPSMKRLTRGSVICFGSTTGGQFCVDTVVVVASANPWRPTHIGDLEADEAFKVCTADSIATAPEHPSLSFTLYQGATFDDPVDGMFSFVPARQADDSDPRFARPPIQFDGLINPASTRRARGSNVCRPLSELKHAWDLVREQVLDAGLVLGISLQTPAREDGDGRDLPTAGRLRC